MSRVEFIGLNDAVVNTANVAAIALMLLVDNSPMVLMAKRRITKDKEYLYTMPGGSVQQGESVLQGGKRELFEETGLHVRSEDLKLVGYPFAINPAVSIQFIFCHLETSATWQWISNTEPKKLASWNWMNMEEFSKLERLGVFPNIDVTGQMHKIVGMTQIRGSMIDRYAKDDSWLGWIHEKELRRRYGLR